MMGAQRVPILFRGYNANKLQDFPMGRNAANS